MPSHGIFNREWRHEHIPHSVPEVKEAIQDQLTVACDLYIHVGDAFSIITKMYYQNLEYQFELVDKHHCRLRPYETMPFWTTQDTRNAVISTLIPAGAAATAFVVFAKDQVSTDWWSAVKKPEWAPKDVRIYSAIDLLTMSPLGYASYLVYKNGGGFDYNDTRLALGLYGANVAIALATIPIIKKKELGCLWKNTALVSLTAAGAAYTFYNIDKKAGLLLLPYALWTGFYAYLTYSIKKENDPVKDL